MMNVEEFVAALKKIADKSDLDNETKKEYCMCVAAVCDSDKSQQLIEEYIQKDGITLKSLLEYAISISPEIEFEDDNEE